MRKLLAIGSNMPGYMPDPDNIAVIHADDDSDYETALTIMFEDMYQDGYYSAETADDDTSDYAMLELVESGLSHKRGELWRDLLFMLRKYGEVGYIISWTTGDMSYWIQYAADDVCSDETCDICETDQ